MWSSTAGKGIHTVNSKDKLDLSIHIFVVNGFTLFKVDSPSCLNDLYYEMMLNNREYIKKIP